MDWETNKTFRNVMVTENVTDFVVDKGFNFTEVNEFETVKAKKFSDYFKPKTLKNAATIGLKYTREALKLLDYFNAAKTVMQVFPQEGMNYEIPNPMNVVSAMSLISNAAEIPVLAPLVALGTVNKVIIDTFWEEIKREMTEETLLQWEFAKQGGLMKAMDFVDRQRSKELVNLVYIPEVTQKTHEKFIQNEFKTLEELEEFSQNDDSDSLYYYFYFQKMEDNRVIIYVDSIFQIY